jgi:hypothetical protein
MTFRFVRDAPEAMPWLGWLTGDPQAEMLTALALIASILLLHPSATRPVVPVH